MFDIMAENCKREINILLLGETGVGKSTWINAFANYLRFESLESAAEETTPYAVIGARFVITDKGTYTQREIQIGDEKITQNEKFEIGASSTQEPKSYVFPFENHVIRLIDTPGIGDTRGIDKDAENFEAILKYLSMFNELHGICILLPPNSSRLTIIFKFCIQELLSHLHKTATQNIVFCFTSALMTQFRPGDTHAALETLLNKEETGIALTKESEYYVDNESFVYLCKRSHGIKFDDDQEDQFKTSWNYSRDQICRMVLHLATIEPHNLKDTLSLNAAKRVIETLSTALVVISQNIQKNMSLLMDTRNDLDDQRAHAKKYTIPEIELVPVPLEHPQVVCTSKRCMTYVRLSGTDIISAKHGKPCCDNCSLIRIFAGKFPNPEVRKCKIFNPETFDCNKCGCPWSTHMHIKYDYQEVYKKSPEKTLEEAIATIKSRISKLKNEQGEISKAGVEFVCFLTSNAIIPYNDSISEYMQMQIKIEKEKQGGADPETLKYLEELKTSHEKQIQVILNAKPGGEDKQESIDVESIFKLFDKLYALEVEGSNLKNMVTNAEKSIQNILPERETHIERFTNTFSRWMLDITGPTRPASGCLVS